MSAKLHEVQRISIQRYDNSIRITADDGFHITLTRPTDRSKWALESDMPTKTYHFSLRYQVHKAVNP